MRHFEKISFEQFKKDISDDINLYNSYELPKRKTMSSAGYDFIAMNDILIKPGEIVKIPTGYKASCENDEVLMIFIRSSLGFKYNVRICNQVGIIDSDYYNNDSNEGHMWVALQNEGTKDCLISKGTGYAQGMFTKFLTCGDEVNETRKGGIGSTNKEE
jgi:dUTP pyrophosphatase